MAEKTVLTGKTTGVSDSYRHTPENVQHGTPKISPSITPFFQIEISIGWFTRLSKSTFHLSHKIFFDTVTLFTRCFSPLFITTKHTAPANTSSNLTVERPKWHYFHPQGRRRWFGLPNPPHGLADPRPFSGNDEGRKKKRLIESGHIYNKSLT